MLSATESAPNWASKRGEAANGTTRPPANDTLRWIGHAINSSSDVNGSFRVSRPLSLVNYEAVG
jgi:hypothetical protein